MKIEFQMGQLLEQEIRAKFFHKEKFPGSWQLWKLNFLLMVKSNVGT